MASEIRFASITLHQCDEASLASLRSFVRGETPLLPDDRVSIANVASTLARDIAVAQEHITRLQSHCNALRQQLALHRSALAPIRNLPPDVMISIFEHILRGKYSSVNAGKPPWTLAQVCCSWRDIVLSARSLWARVTFHSIRVPQNMMTTEIMQEYLRRSGQHPLTVALRGEYDGPIYSLILKESHRWRSLNVEDMNSTFASGLSSLPLGSIPYLEELSIAFNKDNNSNVSLQVSQLKRVCLSYYTGLSLPSMEHITHYGALLAMSELKTLSLFPSLLCCHITLSKNSPTTVETASPLVYHSNLKHLEIRKDFALLDRLVLPALTTLCMNADDDDPLAAVSTIQSFIQRSSCSLSTLIIRSSCLRGTEFLHLRCLEGLVALHFAVKFHRLGTFCQKFTSSDFSSTGILPQLSTLVINFEAMGGLGATKRVPPTWAVFIDILERRLAAGRLKTFRILHKYDSLPPWMVLDLTALSQRSGLHIEYANKNIPRPGLYYEKDFLTAEIWYRS